MGHWTEDHWAVDIRNRAMKVDCALCGAKAGSECRVVGHPEKTTDYPHVRRQRDGFAKWKRDGGIVSSTGL